MKLVGANHPRDFLLQCLGSKHEPLAIWGAMQILRGQPQSGELGLLLSSPYALIQEVALAELALAKDPGAQSLVPAAVKIFLEAEGQLKYQAAYCLSRFPSDFTLTLLSKWAQGCLSSRQTTRAELEAALLSWLGVDPKAPDWLLFQLHRFESDPLVGSVLFNQLLPYAQTQDRFRKLLEFYFRLRDHHGDLEPTDRLLRELAAPELCEWVKLSVAKGFDLPSIYRQTHQLLTASPSLNLEPIWSKMAQSGVAFDSLNPKGVQRPRPLLEGMLEWLGRILEGQPEDHPNHRALWLVQSFLDHLDQLDQTIPRLMEMEQELLLGLCPSLLAKETLGRWLQEPQEHLEEIARYYHSVLVTKADQDQILGLFFPDPPDWEAETCRITQAHSPVGLETPIPEVLWRFHMGELLGYPVPWPSLFPNPGFGTSLAKGLLQIYLANFDQFLGRGDHLNVDYALQLFQLQPTQEAQELLFRNFKALQRQHADFYYQALELLPDPRMLELLEGMYRPGEFDLAQLIVFLCHAFGEPIPPLVARDYEAISQISQRGLKKPVRLECPNCRHSYQYFADVIYVDEGDILRTGRLSAESVWAPNPFHCKGCGETLPFVLDEPQLEELTLQSKVDRILRLNSNQPGLGHRILLLEFPRHHTKSYNPAQFEQLVTQLELDPSCPPGDLRRLWMKLARMYKSLSRFHESLKVLEKLADPRPQERVEVDYLKGVAWYRLGDYTKARPHFDRVVSFYGELKDQPFLEEAKSFLKSMSEDRRRFLVIEGKK